MPRRQKPAGYEKWTWAEINAGRRLSKAEKRWNRMANSLNWDQRSDGTYQAPPQAIPILVVMAGIMFALVIVAPNGTAHTKGNAGLIAMFLMFGLMGVGMLLVLVGNNHRSASKPSPQTSKPNSLPDMLSPAITWFVDAAKRLGRSFLYVASCKWVANLPEWAQPICWGIGIALPLVGGFFLLRLLLGTSPRP